MTRQSSTPPGNWPQGFSNNGLGFPESSTGSPPSHRRGSPAGLLRNLTSRSDLLQKISPFKEKMEPALRQALEHLQLPDLDALEQSVIRKDAFLQPWAEFRDSFMFLQANGITRISSPRQIQRKDLLYFYTFFNEGKLRYDPRADPEDELYTPDPRLHYVIDKSSWDVVEYEKLLYVWLLQAFQVGKAKNPYGIMYFENRNICTAWEQVFVPIVKMVRSQYDVRGRYHYGRLAKLIEEIRPSRLAFPEGNVTYGMDVIVHRSVPSNPVRAPSTEIHPVTGFLKYKKAKWEDDEKELREVYPQYGHVVERPKPKWSFSDWIQEQRAQRTALQRAKALTQLEGGIVSPYPSTPSAAESMNDDFITGHPYEKKLREAREVERKKRESPLLIHMHTLRKRDNEQSSRPGSALPSPRLIPERQGSNGISSAIRTPNPFTEDSENLRLEGVAAKAKLNLPERVLPRQRTKPDDIQTGSPKSKVRKPSYEGTGYGSPLLSTATEAKFSEKVKPSRIPSPIEIRPSESTGTRKYHPIMERVMELATTMPTTYESPPPVPSKNPERYMSVRSQGRQLAEYRTNNLGPRIVSKENIRAALNLTMDDEPLDTSYPSSPVSPTDRSIFPGVGGRNLKTGEAPKVQTFNTHMFPRSAGKDGHRKIA
ncbi:uncharacterized protein EI97DRAFT_461035 [Westerdykella ornata]|uniref:Uncharacterized protein n=1 Tax=Westerdykella ornata TaxID=318751 RepID=A0A6A6JAH6_WESOR|nr:uncharacterized protein EI97DRAFT_461035 [Westerdykella ornata]KAF2273610.1 hypothetical protein EI97DRAFT_461035 [Westerdykella ornata]